MSAGSKSVDRCECMVAVAEVAEVEEVEAEAVVVVADAKAELAEAEVDVVEAGSTESKIKQTQKVSIWHMYTRNSSGRYFEV